MKQKIIIPIVTAIAGLLIGYLIFSGATQSESAVEAASAEGTIWTCSMDPQVRQPDPGDCPICGMDLIPANGDANSNPLVFEMTLDAMKIANIQTTRIGGTAGMSGELRLSGKIKADETTASSIVTHIPGRIEKLYVSFTGESIHQGQRIAKIYSPNLITAQRELLEAYKLRESNPGLFEAAKNKLRYWKISDKVINQIIEDNEIKEYFDIYADHSGVISQKKVSVGDYLKQGSVLFQLQNLNKLWAVFDVYENELQSINIGDEIEFTTTSLPKETFISKVTFIDPVINPSTRTAAVRLELTNGQRLLKPEMFISGVLHLSNPGGVSQYVTVPKSAVLWTGERSVVYVKLPDMEMPSFEYREVVLGESLGAEYIVLDGVFSGDEVVTNGAFVIDASAQLNNQASMMNRNLLTSAEQSFNTPDFEAASNKFKEQLNDAMVVYLSLKDALVQSNSLITKTKTIELEGALEKIDMKLIEGQAHTYWIGEQEILTKSIDEMKDGDLDVQRSVFDELSISMIKLAKAFGLNEYNYVIQYCPMANNDEGGYWMSGESVIRNPYFGDEMLQCGTVKDTIQTQN
ncbi:MAG: efflux RND transporter periplasmic adaptor subunit [Crocinitomicaceae bacterium]|nr:efflux RND transporter periplasmic adaptor subunit [Crocinitomicaceae bacterium]